MKTYFLPVFYTILQLIVLIGIGFFLRKFGKFSDTFFSGISSFLVKVILPVYLFVRIAPGSVEDLKRAWIFPLSAVFIVAIGLFFGFIFFRITRLPSLERKAAVALAAFGNSGFIPLSMVEFFPLTLPVIAELFGITTPLLFVGAYLLVQSALLWSVGNYLILGKEKKIRLRDLVSRSLIGICIAFLFVVFVPQSFFTDTSLPFAHIYSALDRMSDLVLPLALISLGSMIGGLTVKKIRLRDALKIAGGVSLVRFLLVPAVFFGLYFTVLRKLSLTGAQLWVLFLESHVPPALNLSIMVNHAGVNREHTAFTMLFTYLLYIAVFPFFVILFFSLTGISPAAP
jgi:malate permease and related proteins